MILYNVTVNIDPEVHEDWLDWMKKTHIPDVLNTGLFIDNRFLRVLNTEAAPSWMRPYKTHTKRTKTILKHSARGLHLTYCHWYKP